MLQLTHDAAVALGRSIRAQGMPETAGVRVYGERSPAGKMQLAVTFAVCPADADEVSEQDGTRLFVAPEVAEPLAAAALDVRKSPQGERLVITAQGNTST